MLYKIKLCRVTDVDLMNLAIIISIAEYEFECKFVNANIFSSSSTVHVQFQPCPNGGGYNLVCYLDGRPGEMSGAGGQSEAKQKGGSH